jgi:type VI protein secretion system component VasF
MGVDQDVERHERVIYGGNGQGSGILGRLDKVETYMEDLREERKEARESRHKIMTAIISGIVIQLVVLLGVLAASGFEHRLIEQAVIAIVTATPSP